MPIYVFDEFGPEATAMLQALYSRSSQSVTQHIDKVRSTGSSKFMESYYVGYGHASIGDCGTTTIFIEDISIIATKVIQDNPLYSGQESSTRYIDFSKQNIVDPSNSQIGQDIQKRWLDFYLSQQEELISFLEKRFPLQSGQNERIWNKAIQARSFDILRGFLPAGVCTQLSWTTNLRQAADNLVRLSTHPLEEVRLIAEDIHEKLSSKYPSSFSHRIDETRNNYLKDYQAEHALLRPNRIDYEFKAESILKTSPNNHVLNTILNRPARSTLPRNVANAGRYRISCLLDYGSFRDLQRHRNAYCPLPLLTTQLGFNKWYLEQMPDSIRASANNLINEQESHISNLQNTIQDQEVMQYYIPMGYNVQVELEYDLSEILYVSELRSSKTV
ncbi:MAG: FAD-dependent thymidylate synthase, partial [Candidatus Thiodiazotropha endolucinida]|nr:FAD-dependent thymidylate synthase [Candidatus Thiodiazotropha taylori]MCW4342139.1 FAD-dependent thymidylate synthase [Candidatus Thiodiazotropha endolucinida]